MTQLTGPEEQQLRLALGLIGEAAGGDEPATPPRARPVWPLTAAAPGAVSVTERHLRPWCDLRRWPAGTANSSIGSLAPSHSLSVTGGLFCPCSCCAPGPAAGFVTAFVADPLLARALCAGRRGRAGRTYGRRCRVGWLPGAPQGAFCSRVPAWVSGGGAASCSRQRRVSRRWRG